jgi:hypothetical protein
LHRWLLRRVRFPPRLRLLGRRWARLGFPRAEWEHLDTAPLLTDVAHDEHDKRARRHLSPRSP